LGENFALEKLKWPKVFGGRIEMFEMAEDFLVLAVEMLKWRGVLDGFGRSSASGWSAAFPE
jgi:hypothetical protein